MRDAGDSVAGPALPPRDKARPGRPEQDGVPCRGALPLAVPAVIFLLTGAAGIILQVLWQRVLSLVFGNTVEATGAVLGAFLGCLAIGSAAVGLVSLRGLGDLLVNLAAALSIRSYWSVLLVQALVSAQVVLLPAFLGGLVLPVVLRGAYRADSLGRRVERVDVVELNPHVVEAADRFFREVNRGVLHGDPRLRVQYGDGRNVMLATSARYDVILSDSIHPRFAGNGSLYTREYYEIGRRRLEPGGLVSQWLPLYGLPPDAYRMIVRAFLDVFPDSVLWHPHRTPNANSILIGSPDGVRFGLRSLGERMRDPELAADLAAIGIGGAHDFVSNFVAGSRGLRALTEGAPPHTDDVPLVEYAAGRAEGSRLVHYRTWTWKENLSGILAVREQWDAGMGGEASAAIGRKLAAHVALLEQELE